MRSFKLKIVTPDGMIYDGEAESLLVHTTDGDVEFLAGHSDYMAALGTGRARLRIDGRDELASVSGGFITVSRGEVSLMAITYEPKDKIDLARARSAADSARAALADAKDSKSKELAAAKLSRALCRIKVAEM